MAALGGLPTVFWFTAALAGSGIVILILLVPPSPPVMGVDHTEERVILWSKRRGLGDTALVHLNFGVFVLHFILVAFFLVVPGIIENSLGVDREHHWMVYLPVLLLSLAGMVPLMILAERGGRLRQMFLLAIALVFVVMATLDYAAATPLLYGGLWLFFVGFNYLEATLPSLLSKTVSTRSKGTAMGVYSTCQFMGAFAGGAGGGWLLDQLGEGMLSGVCLALAAAWWLVVLRMPRSTEVENSTRSPLPGV
jgi:predicted MFS family arabinose efflux permease